MINELMILMIRSHLDLERVPLRLRRLPALGPDPEGLVITILIVAITLVIATITIIVMITIIIIII